MSWPAYLQSVNVSFAVPVRFGVEEEGDEPCVFVELTVVDQTSGETITVRTRQRVLPLGMLTDREAACVVRDLMRIAIVHEIDEAITIDGARPFDPHRAGAWRTKGDASK